MQRHFGKDINPKGTGSVRVTSQSATAIPLVVKAASSQSDHLQDWQNSSGTALSYITSAGVFTGDGSGHLDAEPTRIDWLRGRGVGASPSFISPVQLRT